MIYFPSEILSCDPISLSSVDPSRRGSSCGTRFKRNRDPDPKLKDLGEELLELLGASLPDG